MTMEVQGSLIEMNAHRVMSQTAQEMIFWGIVIIVLFAILTGLNETQQHDKRRRIKARLTIGFLLCIGIAMIAAGCEMPRIREITYCANGPVSIEHIASMYEIVDIDGKQITVRERGG